MSSLVCYGKPCGDLDQCPHAFPPCPNKPTKRVIQQWASIRPDQSPAETAVTICDSCLLIAQFFRTSPLFLVQDIREN